MTENARVLESVRALERGDLGELGRLMRASHDSLRDDYRVSTPELDALVEALVDAGALGARLTGPFGGAVVAVCDAGDVSAVGEAAMSRYRAATAGSRRRSPAAPWTEQGLLPVVPTRLADKPG